jgi:acetoin utilization deacetylase AcuC-like enzyme
VNVPLSAGFGDGDFVSIYNRVLKPIALDFRPELILVSAGFDIHVHDPLSNMSVTPQGFAGLTRGLMDIADTCCNGKIVITLEGGYDIRGQRNSVKSVLEELADISKADTEALLKRLMLQQLILPLSLSLKSTGILEGVTVRGSRRRDGQGRGKKIIAGCLRV